jgi:hypothetical protein
MFDEAPSERRTAHRTLHHLEDTTSRLSAISRSSARLSRERIVTRAVSVGGLSPETV